MENVNSSGVRSPDIQVKDKQRTIQREKIFHDYVKDSSARENIFRLIPSDKIRTNTSVDEIFLKYLAESLGKNTHTVLFGLAATSKNPVELSNTLFNIANLKNIHSLYWKLEESEDHLLGRNLPEHINVSKEAEKQAENMVAGKETVGSALNPQHLLESFFYIVSRGDVSLEDERRILNEFYNTKGFSPLGTKNAEKICSLQSSFWSHVDGSWIYSDGKKSNPMESSKPKEPNIMTKVGDAISKRRHYEEQIVNLSNQIVDLRQKLSEASERATRFENNNGELQRDLSTAQTKNQDLERQLYKVQHQQGIASDANLLNQIADLNRRLSEESGRATHSERSNRELRRKFDIIQAEKQELERQLREAQRKQPRTEPFGEQPRSKGQPKDPYVVLNIPPSATSKQIKAAYGRLLQQIHPDQITGRLKEVGVNPQVVAAIDHQANERAAEVNGAYAKLKKMGKVE